MHRVGHTVNGHAQQNYCSLFAVLVDLILPVVLHLKSSYDPRDPSTAFRKDSETVNTERKTVTTSSVFQKSSKPAKLDKLLLADLNMSEMDQPLVGSRRSVCRNRFISRTDPKESRSFCCKRSHLTYTAIISNLVSVSLAKQRTCCTVCMSCSLRRLHMEMPRPGRPKRPKRRPQEMGYWYPIPPSLLF